MKVSLRARLLLALGAVALVSLVAADIATYSFLRSFLLQRVDQQLQAAHIPIEQALNGGGPGGLGTGGLGAGGLGAGGPSSAAESCQTDALLRAAPGTFVQVRSSAGIVLCQQDSYERGVATTQPKLPVRITGFSSSSDPNEPTVYFTVPASDGPGPSYRVRASQAQGGNTIVLAISLADETSTLHHLLWVELAVTAAALALAGLLGWWLVRIGLRPLAAIETTAANIARGGLGERVPGESRRTEVGRLAGVLNVMLARIEGAFAARDATESELRRSEARMRRFVGDASHELRTPLTAVSAYAELFERGANQRPEDLERVMTGIRSETSRMGHLVDDLLLLARMDEGRPMDMGDVELVALAAEAIDAGRAVGSQWPVTLEAARPVEVTGDRVRLRQVFDNLLANVRAHTPAGTSATVRIGVEADHAVCEVCDNGPGIEAETADRLFERFYRADASRSRASGGSGLGLSIVEAIVSAHGGDITARAGPDGGSVFSFRIPLHPTGRTAARRAYPVADAGATAAAGATTDAGGDVDGPTMTNRSGPSQPNLR